jgi:glutathionyl-hydroquinone reductase
MGILIEGAWRDAEFPQEVGRAGEFRRADSRFRDRITADGSSGFKAEPGRYHLYVAHGCPWAHRTLIYRAIKKLDGLISVAYAIPGLKQIGWTFEDDPHYPDCFPDKVSGFHHLYEAYVASNPTYTGKVTVPTLWDKKTKKIVNNESSEIIRMLNTEFQRHHRRPHRPLSAGFACRDRRGQRAHLSQRQQRRVPRRLREVAGRLRRGL